mmetsp:Transcript_11206/g.9582  ORF Transcript_11206/g.9582 Transcript_11206/m.9582 type:complete len:91 (+) Transcript_11206:756-1028(+)
MCFADCQTSNLVGVEDEFVNAPRLDNLFSSYAALKSLADHSTNLENDKFINLICLFDNEEVGSKTAQGADSPIMLKTMKRIFKILAGDPS